VPALPMKAAVPEEPVDFRTHQPATFDEGSDR